MAMSTIKQQASFIKSLEENLKTKKPNILVEHDQSETEDIIGTKIAGKNHSKNGAFCCCDQSETETLIPDCN